MKKERYPNPDELAVKKLSAGVSLCRMRMPLHLRQAHPNRTLTITGLRLVI